MSSVSAVSKVTSLWKTSWGIRAESLDRIQSLLGFISSVFFCSSVLLDYMKDQNEKTDAILSKFELVEKVVEMCEYTKTLKYMSVSS